MVKPTVMDPCGWFLRSGDRGLIGFGLGQEAWEQRASPDVGPSGAPGRVGPITLQDLWRRDR